MPILIGVAVFINGVILSESGLGASTWQYWVSNAIIAVVGLGSILLRW